MERHFTELTDLSGAASKLQAEESVFVEGSSPSMRTVEAVVRELGQSRVPVLLLAETGAGKRTMARRIHLASRQTAGEFRVVGCAALTPQDLADAGDRSLFRQGTVFLEEIGDLNPACQLKLLEILPKAEANGGRADAARLICGSTRDLEPEVRCGRFREDLYYRISGVCLRLPPLRQRKEDISSLTDFFLAKYAHDFRRPMPTLSGQTRQLFRDYAWPGNIRELEDAAKAIVALGDESVAMGGLRSVLTKSDHTGDGERVSLKHAARAASREAERKLILKVLTRTRWNRRRAAQELQISYKALLYKLKQIGYGEQEAT